eukprot:26351_1
MSTANTNNTTSNNEEKSPSKPEDSKSDNNEASKEITSDITHENIKEKHMESKMKSKNDQITLTQSTEEYLEMLLKGNDSEENDLVHKERTFISVYRGRSFCLIKKKKTRF